MCETTIRKYHQVCKALRCQLVQLALAIDTAFRLDDSCRTDVCEASVLDRSDALLKNLSKFIDEDNRGFRIRLDTPFDTGPSMTGDQLYRDLLIVEET